MKILFGALLVFVASTTGTAQDIYNRARSSLSAGDTAKAVSGFQEALRAGQKVGDSNYYLGIIALARGKTDEAVGFLSKAADLEDDNVSILRAAAMPTLPRVMCRPPFPCTGRQPSWLRPTPILRQHMEPPSLRPTRSMRPSSAFPQQVS